MFNENSQASFSVPQQQGFVPPLIKTSKLQKETNKAVGIMTLTDLSAWQKQQQQSNNAPKHSLPYNKHAEWEQSQSKSQLKQVYYQQLNMESEVINDHYVFDEGSYYCLLAQSKGRKNCHKFLHEVRTNEIKLTIPFSNVQTKSELEIELEINPHKQVTIFCPEKKVSFLIKKSMSSITLQVRMQVDGTEKIWKEVELPMNYRDHNVSFKVTELGNEEIRVHLQKICLQLSIEYPLQRDYYYYINHSGGVAIRGAEIKICSHQQKSKEPILCDSPCLTF